MKYSVPIKLLFTDFWEPVTVETCQNNRLYRILSRHFNISLSDDPDFLIYSCFGFDYLEYDCPRIFFTCENVRPNWNQCDYAFSFDYPETERNNRIPWYRFLENEYNQLCKPRDIDKIIAKRRKFCCCLISNPNAIERLRFLKRLSKYKIVDSGGAVSNTIGYRVENTIANKIAFFSEYKFNIAFENSQYPGYTTEKLMNALVSNTVPIYWGNPEVAKDFNPRAFINCHDYSSFDEVVEVVKAIDQDEDFYKEYLSQPRFPNNIENQFVQEDRIVERFARIFTSKKMFIPVADKRRQRNLKSLYPIRDWGPWFFRNAGRLRGSLYSYFFVRSLGIKHYSQTHLISSRAERAKL